MEFWLVYTYGQINCDEGSFCSDHYNKIINETDKIIAALNREQEFLTMENDLMAGESPTTPLPR